MKGARTVTTDPTAAQTAEAKSYLDSIVVTLTIPIPLLMALGLAAYSLATKTTPREMPTVPISGTQVPFPLAAVMVMILNSLLLIHVARMTALLSGLLRKEATTESTANVLLYHAGMLNPFAGPASFRYGQPGIIGWTISLMPKIAVGALIGFYALFLVTIGDFGPQIWGHWLLPVIALATLMHTIGIATSMLQILWLNMDLRGFISCIPYLLGFAAGMTVGYLVDTAIGTGI
jgi:hypothetical protein